MAASAQPGTSREPGRPWRTTSGWPCWCPATARTSRRCWTRPPSPAPGWPSSWSPPTGLAPTGWNGPAGPGSTPPWSARPTTPTARHSTWPCATWWPRARPDVVCLAGFMRILGPGFVRAFPDRILNTHPSLLPAFRGAHAVREALAYGVKVTGCTVHLVDEEVDHGPVLFQSAVPVEPGDDEDRLHERIKQEERRLLPLAVRLLAEGRVRVEGRRAQVVTAAGGVPVNRPACPSAAPWSASSTSRAWNAWPPPWPPPGSRSSPPAPPPPPSRPTAWPSPGSRS